MRVPAAALVILLLLPASPAAGCALACFDAGSGVSSVSQPIRRAPAPTPRPVRRPTPAPTPRPAPVPVRPQTIAAQMGLHAVTQVWAGDVVTKTGPVTTYTSNTVTQNAGTYAKQVATVVTGQVSPYDAALSNRRTTMTDGRAVSGDIYANYVWTGSSLVLDRFVFFQDDREVARQPATVPAPRPVAPTLAPLPTPRPAPAPAQTSAPLAMVVVPTSRPASAPVVTQPPAPATPRPTPTPAPRTVRGGIALAAQGDPLARIEVLRGRRVDLWARATVDGAPGSVRSWQLASGEVTALAAISGSGDQPFAGMWVALAPIGSSFTVRFTLTVAVPGEPDRRVDASIDVVVRSPALVE